MICSVDACNSEVLARGWCQNHYMQWWRNQPEQKEKARLAARRYRAANGDKVREANRLRRERDRDKINARQRELRAQNREAVRADARRRYAENPEKQREYRQRWYWDNVETARASALRYHKENPEVARRAAARRRARKLENGAVPYREANIYERDKWTCQLCGGKVRKTLRWPDRGSASIDHIIPLIEGGADAPWNVQLAHIGCNWTKHTGAPESGDQLMLEVSA